MAPLGRRQEGTRGDYHDRHHHPKSRSHAAIVALRPFVCYIPNVQLWTAFQHTGWMGKAVLSILLLFSIGSWGVVIVDGRRFSRSGQASQRFVVRLPPATRA